MTNNRSVLASTGDSVILPEVAERLRNTSVSVIKEMMYLGSLEKKKGRDIVSIGVGLPFYPAPKEIHEYIIEKLKTKTDIDKYTLLIGLPELRQIFAALTKKELDIDTTIDEVLVTPGSMSALLYSFLSIVNPGEEVILPSPYFSSHAEQVSIAGGKVIPIPMIKDEKTGYRLDIEAIKKAINPKTKAILINSPHNPTGAVFAKENLLELAKLVKNTNIYIITDEVYEFLVFDGLEYFNIAQVKELWPKVIRCCSLSKKYGMMGWRLGFLHTNKDLLMNILKVHDSMIVCAPHISQEAGICALTMNQDVVKQHVAWLEQNRDLMCKRLDALPDLFTYVKPRGAYYAFPKFSVELSSIDMAKELLFEAGVITVPGVGFGPNGEQHLRLSFGSSQKEINESFDRIDKWWKTKK